MDQLHRRFSDEQIKVLFRGYCQGLLSRAEVRGMLSIEKTRFFALLKQYREDPDGSECVKHCETTQAGN